MLRRAGEQAARLTLCTQLVFVASFTCVQQLLGSRFHQLAESVRLIRLNDLDERAVEEGEKWPGDAADGGRESQARHGRKKCDDERESQVNAKSKWQYIRVR